MRVGVGGGTGDEIEAKESGQEKREWTWSKNTAEKLKDFSSDFQKVFGIRVE